jgi:hypothetical protein
VNCDRPSSVQTAALQNATHSLRDDIKRQIADIENALKAMKRPLNAEEQRSAAQIHTFVIRARAALNVDDLDGASTLSAKAHALLLELSKRSSREKPHVLLIN